MGDEIVLSVIAPMFNEEAHIRENLGKLLDVLHRCREPWELILVNDGSTDNTLAAVQEAAGDEQYVQVISYRRNRGRGYALRTGFAVAKGQYIITTESDLSWGADIVLRLYSELRNNKDLDVVIASPYMKGGRLENVPLERALLSRFGNKILTFAVPGNVTMISGMTRGYRREAIKSLDLQSDGKEIHLEIVSKCIVLGYRISEIPGILRWEKPSEGGVRRKSSFNATKLISSHLMFSLYEKPMMLFGLVGLSLIVLGLIGGGYIIYLWQQRALTPERPLMTLLVLLILAGIQVLSFGFLSTQLMALRKEVYRVQGENKRLEQLMKAWGVQSRQGKAVPGMAVLDEPKLWGNGKADGHRGAREYSTRL